MKDLLEQVKQNVPGQKPCDQAIEKLRSAQTEMEQAAISATAGQLKPQEATNLQGYQTQLESATMEIKELIEPLAESAKCHPEKLGHHVATLSLYFDPVSRATIGAASKLTDMDRQQDLFSQVCCKSRVYLHYEFYSFSLNTSNREKNVGELKWIEREC